MASSTNDDDLFFKTAELSRLMVPADANVAGNVHGGIIMEMMEQSANVAASRYFNHYSAASDAKIHVMTARVESLTFQQPLLVGDVAKVQAQVVFASHHTLAVAVKLLSERLATRHEDLVVGNRAIMWIVGHVVRGEDSADKFELAIAPKLDPPTKENDKEAFMAYQLASMAYNRRKAHQEADPASLPNSGMMDEDKDINPPSSSAKEKQPMAFSSPDDSAVELAQVMLPADCVTGGGLVGGGVVMKLLDNASGVAAVRHCGTNVVTVSVDAVDLAAPVRLGDVLRIRARPIFTSNKSIEISLQVIAERYSLGHDNKFQREEIVAIQQAYFTFVSLAPNSNKALSMRPLEPKTADDKKLFQQGKERYEQRKALRSPTGATKKP